MFLVISCIYQVAEVFVVLHWWSILRCTFIIHHSISISIHDCCQLIQFKITGKKLPSKLVYYYCCSKTSRSTSRRWRTW